jgi:hypothetical protein
MKEKDKIPRLFSEDMQNCQTSFALGNLVEPIGSC